MLGGCTSSPRAGPVGLRSKQCLGIWSAGTSSFAPRSRAAVCNPLTVGIRGEADEVRQKADAGCRRSAWGRRAAILQSASYSPGRDIRRPFIWPINSSHSIRLEAGTGSGAWWPRWNGILATCIPASALICFTAQASPTCRDRPQSAGQSGAILDHAAGEIGEDRCQGGQPWPLRHVPIGRGCGAEGTVPEKS